MLRLLYFIIFLVASAKLFAKEYIFIGIPSLQNAEKIIPLLENSKKDKISFVVPDSSKQEMREITKKFGKHINKIAYIHDFPKERLSREIDTFDKEFNKVVAAYKIIHESLSRVDGIISASEYTVYPAARLRTLYNIQGLKCAQGAYFRDKIQMKDRISSAIFKGRPVSISLPKYAPLNEGMKFDHIISQMHKADIEFPIILKPRNSAGSLGVYLVKDKEQLRKVLAKHNNTSPYEVNEFIDAPVIHVNGVVQDGCIKFISSYENGDTPLNSGIYGKYGEIHFEIKGKEIEHKLYNIASEIIFRLGMENGVFHLELFKDKENKITFLEIAARPPGGEIISVVEAATGVNIQEINFLIDMNTIYWKKFLATKLKKRPKFHALYLTAFNHHRAIKVTDVNTSLLTEVCIDKKVLPKVGDIIEVDNSFYKNMGIFVFSATTVEGLKKGHEILRSKYIIKYNYIDKP